MTRRYKDALRDILDAIEKAQSFVAGIDFDTFEANDEKNFRSHSCSRNRRRSS